MMKIKKIKNKIKYLFLLLPSSVFASTDTNALSDAINGITDFLTGDLARCIGILAIVGVGYATLMLGKLDKGKAINIILGIGVIFSAAYIFNQLGI